MATNELLKEEINAANEKFQYEKALELADINHQIRKNQINTRNLFSAYTESELVDVYLEEVEKHRKEREAIIDSIS